MADPVIVVPYDGDRPKAQVEIVFVRHAQGEHTTRHPSSLNIRHPALTDWGMEQARNLTAAVGLRDDDILIASPTKRTIQTANLLIGDRKNAKYITPLIGPRMFPYREELATLPCDEIYTRDVIESEHKDFIPFDLDHNVWLAGINQLDHIVFIDIADKFVTWCKREWADKRILLITHDGTINNYRQALGEKHLTRGDFLGDAGFYKMTL